MDHYDTRPDSGNKFHWLFLPGQKANAAGYDTIVDETQNFVVLPTKGSIVPGWVLIVPKFPIPRIAHVPRELRDELRSLVCRVSETLQTKFGNTYTFEHGGFEGSKVSCGVDQAHLHVAALDFDLIKAAELESPDHWVDLGAVSIPGSEVAKGEYWFVSNANSSRCKTIDRPHSQFFRRIIAHETGMSEFWDYRSNDFIENVSTTIEAMGANG